MTKRAFERIKEGLEEALAIARGEADPSTYRVHAPPGVDVKGIRKRLGLSQAAFAASFGLPAGSVRDWEQGRRQPDTAARAYLKVIAKRPDAVREALAEP